MVGLMIPFDEYKQSTLLPCGQNERFSHFYIIRFAAPYCACNCHYSLAVDEWWMELFRTDTTDINQTGALDVYSHPSGFSECSGFNRRLFGDTAECRFPTWLLADEALMTTASWAAYRQCCGWILKTNFTPSCIALYLEEDVTEAN